MRETLLIRLTGLYDLAVESVCLNDVGKPIAGSRRDSLAEAATQSAGRRVVVLVPANDVLLTRAIVPTTNRQRARKALPFALEDLLAEDIDGLHFALGVRDAEGQWPVAVVARKRMDAWLQHIARGRYSAGSLSARSTRITVGGRQWRPVVGSGGRAVARSALVGAGAHARHAARACWNCWRRATRRGSICKSGIAAASCRCGWSESRPRSSRVATAP